MIPTFNSPDLKLNLPKETTLATLNQYYSQINQTWEAGSQTVDNEGVILTRDYKILSFPPSESKLLKVDLPAYDPDWEASFYYFIISYFTETSYSSHYKSTVKLPFNEWKKKDTIFRNESYYKHKQVGQLVYNRPITSEPEVTPPVYAILPVNYKLTINVGTALGAVISSISPIEVRVKDTTEDVGTVVNPSFILLTKPYIDIIFKQITTTSHVVITTTFYGEYTYSSAIPKSQFDNQEEFTLVHPYNTSYQSRLKPPGLSTLPDNFWNTNYGTIPSLNLVNRGSAPAWN